MNPERLQQIEDLFIEALEQMPTVRREFVERAAKGDAAIVTDVLELLDAAHEPGPLDSIAGDLHTGSGEYGEGSGELEADHGAKSGRSAGSLIGPYRIVREIGHGGMGTVFLAEPAAGDGEAVALKLLREDLVSDQLRQRFLREQEILGRISHPHIARFLDGGFTNEGHPYFVLEYVDGVRIDEYCDGRRLPIGNRLRLFCDMCSAVQYAHDHHVIHRDIKPGNILVDGSANTKLLDFGIAKPLLADSFAGLTTQAGALPLTPEYASPEQVRGARVTPASDVYQLGVVLYELLTGHRPLRFSNRTLPEIVRVLSKVEPVPPSEIVTQVGEVRRRGTTERVTWEHVSHSRNTAPDVLRRQLEGDLDAIVMTALCKSVNDRHHSARELSLAIERFLRDCENP